MKSVIKTIAISTIILIVELGVVSVCSVKMIQKLSHIVKIVENVNEGKVND